MSLFSRAFAVCASAIVVVCVTPAAAQFGNLGKNLLKSIEKEAEDVINDVLVENIGCGIDLSHADAMGACLDYTMSKRIENQFNKMLNDPEMALHSDAVLTTIITGEESAWESSSGASGKAVVVEEKTTTKSKEVPVLKDKIETVPPLTFVGQNYRANSSVNMRGGPGTDYKVVGSVPAGGVINVIGSVDGQEWFLVGEGGVATGYVYKPLLTPAPTAEATETTQPSQDQIAAVETNTTASCKEIEQVVTGADGKQKTKKIKACQTANGWEVV